MDVVRFLIEYACYLGIAIPFWFGEPVARYRFVAEYNREVVRLPDEAVAWRLIRDAASLPRVSIAGARSPDALIAPTTPDDPLWNAMVEAVEQEQAFIELAIEATRRSRMGIPLVRHDDHEFDAERWESLDQVDLSASPSPVHVALPQLAVLRRMASALAADCRVAAEAHDSWRVLRDIRAIVHLAPLAFDSPAIAGYLQGLAIYGIAETEIGSVVAAYPGLLDDDDLACLLADLQTARLTLPVVDIDADLRAIEHHIDSLFTDDGSGNGILTYRGLAGGRVASLPPVSRRISSIIFTGSEVQALVRSFGTRAQAVALVDEIRSALRVDIASPSWLRYEWASDRFVTLRGDRTEFVTQLPLATMVPDLQRTILARDAIGVRLDAAMLAIAVERFRLQFGRYPESGDEIATHGLLPRSTDPFNGEPLRLKAQTSGPPTVYSVGIDRQDDGAEPACESSFSIKLATFEALPEPEQRRYRGDARLWPPICVKWIDGGEHPFMHQRLTGRVSRETKR